MPAKTTADCLKNALGWAMYPISPRPPSKFGLRGMAAPALYGRRGRAADRRSAMKKIRGDRARLFRPIASKRWNEDQRRDQGKASKRAGGYDFTYIPCLNDDLPAHMGCAGRRGRAELMGGGLIRRHRSPENRKRSSPEGRRSSSVRNDDLVVSATAVSVASHDAPSGSSQAGEDGTRLGVFDG